MTFSRLAFLPLILGCAVVTGGCTHTPPGTSVLVALARRPEVVAYPAPPPSAQPKNTVATGGTTARIEPEKTELVADAFSRAEFCLGTGNDDAAIAAFREVVKIDPKHGDAWNKLAMLYEKTGQEPLAMDAFRKAKALGGQKVVQQ
jgi:tetratricopeptide (TPR) repeat protein